jgi:protein-disulfide isomerase
LSDLRSGVNGTPSFYLNGQKWEGDWTSGELDRDIATLVRRRPSP